MQDALEIVFSQKMSKSLFSENATRRTVFQRLGKKCQSIEKEDLKIDDPHAFTLIFSNRLFRLFAIFTLGIRRGYIKDDIELFPHWMGFALLPK